MRLEFGFGTGTQSVEVCDDRLAGILHANEPPPGLTGEDAVRAALDAPIGAPPIEQVVRLNEKIAIVTSDITRPLSDVEDFAAAARSPLCCGHKKRGYNAYLRTGLPSPPHPGGAAPSGR